MAIPPNTPAETRKETKYLTEMFISASDPLIVGVRHAGVEKRVGSAFAMCRISPIQPRG